jgi:hypothetical protein
MTPLECYYEIKEESKKELPFGYLKPLDYNFKLNDKERTDFRRKRFFEWEERKRKSREYARKRREKIK